MIYPPALICSVPLIVEIPEPKLNPLLKYTLTAELKASVPDVVTFALAVLPPDMFKVPVPVELMKLCVPCTLIPAFTVELDPMVSVFPFRSNDAPVPVPFSDIAFPPLTPVTVRLVAGEEANCTPPPLF